jgi:hypothetical protein
MSFENIYLHDEYPSIGSDYGRGDIPLQSLVTSTTWKTCSSVVPVLCSHPLRASSHSSKQAVARRLSTSETSGPGRPSGQDSQSMEDSRCWKGRREDGAGRRFVAGAQYGLGKWWGVAGNESTKHPRVVFSWEALVGHARPAALGSAF